MNTSLFKNEKNVSLFTAGQSIFQRGDKGDFMCALIEGEVSISINGKTIETISEGQIFGEMAIIDESERSADAVAVTDCKLALIDEKRFLFMVQNSPFFAIEVMRALTKRLRRNDL